MKLTTNKAVRLHKLTGKVYNASGDLSIRTAFAAAFGLPKEDQPGIFRGLTAAIELIDGLERDLKLAAADELYFSHLNSFRLFYCPTNFESHLAHHKPLLSSDAFMTLQFCSVWLRDRQPEPDLTDEVLKDLSTSIDALREKVKEGNIERELEVILLDLIEAMRRSIAEFEIRGVSSLREELASILEKIHRHANKDTQEVRDLFTILSHIESLTSVLVNGAQLIPYAKPLLQLVTGISS